MFYVYKLWKRLCLCRLNFRGWIIDLCCTEDKIIKDTKSVLKVIPNLADFHFECCVFYADWTITTNIILNVNKIYFISSAGIHPSSSLLNTRKHSWNVTWCPLHCDQYFDVFMSKRWTRYNRHLVCH